MNSLLKSTKMLARKVWVLNNIKNEVIIFRLKRSEKHYPASKLALKWAVTEKLNDYLCGNKFIVVTDNNPLAYALSKASWMQLGIDDCLL